MLIIIFVQHQEDCANIIWKHLNVVNIYNIHIRMYMFVCMYVPINLNFYTIWLNSVFQLRIYIYKGINIVLQLQIFILFNFFSIHFLIFFNFDSFVLTKMKSRFCFKQQMCLIHCKCIKYTEKKNPKNLLHFYINIHTFILP